MTFPDSQQAHPACRLKHRRIAKAFARGFTLIELIIVMLVVAILLTVAVPNFDSTLAESKLDKARYSLATSLAFARTEAVKRGTEVDLCVGTSDAACGTTDTGNNDSWGDGWKVYDANAGVLRRDQSENQGITISYDCGEVLTFNGLGARTSSAGNCEFTFTDDGLSKKLIVSATGRAQMD